MNIEDFADGSDSSDEDYVPDDKTTLPSEEESDGDVEDDAELSEGKRGRKLRKKGYVKRKKTKFDHNKEECKSEEKEKDEETKKTSNLWADFMKDTGFKTRAERQQETTQTDSQPELQTPSTKASDQTTAVEVKEKVIVTEVYHFAGEEVRVDKEVDRNSAEAKQISKAAPSVASTNGKANRPSGGGLGSVLQKLGKKNKISTLEKSKLDWEKYKKAENIQDELQAYSKSKDGYLERQDFLQRADLRQFEIEKGIRNTLRSNRMNNI